MCKSRSVAGHPSRERRRFGLPTALGPRRSSRRAAQFLTRLFGVSGLVRSGVASLARSVPPLHEPVARMPPRELERRLPIISKLREPFEQKSTSRRRRTLMSAVVAPTAAATGMLGTTRAPSQGRAVPRTVPASAAVAAPTAAYFWAQHSKRSQGASQPAKVEDPRPLEV